MNTYRLGRLATISLASLLFVGCDDPATGGSDGNSDSAGSTSSDDASGTSGTPDSAGSDSNSAGTTTSDGGTDSAADDSSTSGGADTDAGDDTTTGADSSGGGEDESSTGEGGGEEGGGEEGGGEEGGKIDVCEAPGDLTPCDDLADAPSAFQAMGLGCEGGPNEVIPVINPIFQAADSTTWRIITQYGTHIDALDGLPTWRPREGSSMLMISTGQLPAPDAAGVLTGAGTVDSSGNPDYSALPAPLSPLPGSAGGAGGTPFVNCDLLNDCSDSLIDQWNLGNGQANDLLWFQFETPVPNGTYGFSFDFAYFSEEFPEWVDSSFNDMFVAWSNSESYTGNLCFVNDEPCTVTALWPAAYQAGAAELAGTGFTSDAATGWYQANGTAVPGELLQLTFAVFDMGDTVLDTAVILDNFRWDCEGCTPSEVEPCIGIDPV